MSKINPKNEALFIGSGSSLGVPVIGCHCETCRSTNPKNKRTRSSLLLTIDGMKILIDAGPDFRTQALLYQIEHLDGVIFTHGHHDHTAGIDDLRIYYFKNKAPVPCLVSKTTADDLKRRFYFMFTEQPREVPDNERLRLQILPDRQGKANFLGIELSYFSYQQISAEVLGIRIGSFAYITDIKEHSPAIFEHLKGVETLVVSALRFTSSHMHLSVDEAVDFIEQIRPERAYLTHTAHELEYVKANAYLPPNIRLAYDGLQIPI